jgi:hypothetical protein
LRGFARTCVFAKQSLGPIHCDPSERQTRSPPPRQAPLLPKLRGHYAEFLDHVSLVHLRLLASPTCVGLRYGHSRDSLPGFSRPPTPLPLAAGCPLALASALGVLRRLRPYTVNPHNRGSFVPGSPGSSTSRERGRNLNRLPIVYAFGAST